MVSSIIGCISNNNFIIVVNILDGEQLLLRSTNYPTRQRGDDNNLHVSAKWVLAKFIRFIFFIQYASIVSINIIIIIRFSYRGILSISANNFRF
jgi:hypothetical protein